MAEETTTINMGSPTLPTPGPDAVVPGPTPEKDTRTAEDNWIKANGGDDEGEEAEGAEPQRQERRSQEPEANPADTDDELPEEDQTQDDSKPEPTDAAKSVVISPRERVAYAETLRQQGWTDGRIERFFQTATDEDVNWVDAVTRQASQREASAPVKPQADEKPFVERIAPELESLKERWGDELAEPLGKITGAFEKELGGYREAMQSLAKITEQALAQARDRSDQLEWQLAARELAAEIPVLADKSRTAKIQEIARGLVKSGAAKGMDMPALIKRAATVYVSELPKAVQAKMNADSHRNRSNGTPTRQGVVHQHAGTKSKLSPEDQWAVDNGFPISGKK